MTGFWRLFLLAVAWVLDTLAAIPLLWLGDWCARGADALERRAGKGAR